MKERVKKELKNFSEKDFIHFYKCKEGWLYFFSNLIKDDESFNKKRENLFYKRETFDYSLGNELYNEIASNSKYNGILCLYKKLEKNRKVGEVYSCKYSTRKECFENDLKKLLKLIKKEKINISTNQTFESLIENAHLIELKILNNNLNIDLEEIANQELSANSIDLIEKYYKVIFSKFNELIKEL